MKLITILVVVTIALLASGTGINAQEIPASEQEAMVAREAFEAANALMQRQKYAEALARYKQALAIWPDNLSLLFNSGLAAYLSSEYTLATDLWTQVKKADPLDWRVRAKLVQAYQALGRPTERDAERAELFELRRSGSIEELSSQYQYCRDQFEVNGLKVMVFEHFELKGDRALRYVFSVINEAGGGDEYRISLGSYELTNAFWRETTTPRPKEEERLFHLDGYYNWGHATFGMFAPEPSYDETRSKVVRILEGKDEPMSSSTIDRPGDTPAEED